MRAAGANRRSSVLAKLLVVYLALVLYLYLASWLSYLNFASLPLGNLPAGSLLPLTLLGVVAVTLYNSWRKRKNSPRHKPS